MLAERFQDHLLGEILAKNILTKLAWLLLAFIITQVTPSALSILSSNKSSQLLHKCKFKLVLAKMKRILTFFNNNVVADTNHLERIQRLATRLVTGIRQLTYEERLQWLSLNST